jgi:hypothetical protein
VSLEKKRKGAKVLLFIVRCSFFWSSKIHFGCCPSLKQQLFLTPYRPGHIHSVFSLSEVGLVWAELNNFFAWAFFCLFFHGYQKTNSCQVLFLTNLFENRGGEEETTKQQQTRKRE